MSNINTVGVSGNITRDPEFKQITDTFATAKFGLAVNRQKKNADGEYEEIVSFFDVEVLGESYAKMVARKMKKGDSVTIQGRLEQQRWENTEGEKRSKVVIIANDIDGEWQFRSKDEDTPIDAQEPAAPTAPPASEPVAVNPPDDDIPF